MFSGVIESQSHEGGFLVSFSGSSPALESIIIKAESGEYIGKVDAVLGNTTSPLAHVAHIDRKLDLPSLIGCEVGIRAKKQREERGRDFGNNRNDDRRRDDRSGRDSRDRRSGGFERNDRRNDNRGDNRNGGDWDCPKCQNSNFAFRQECNRCGEPRGAGGGSHRGERRDYGRNDRDGGRFERNDRRNDNRGDNRNGGGDWDCPKCQNSNFAFRQECNRCEAPRPGGRGGGGRGDYNQRDSRGRNDGRFDRNQRRGDDNRRPRGEVYNDNDWECPQCQNSNFAFRQECNRCEAPRPGGRGGAGRNESRGRPQRRDDRGRSSYGGNNRSPRRDDSGGRPPRRDDSGGRPPRHDDSGGRPPRRDDRRSSSHNDRDSRPPQRAPTGARPPRRDGRNRQEERGGYQRSNDSRGGFNQRRDSRDDRPSEQNKREPREFRKSRGKGPGHAHNRPPKPLYNPNNDD